MSCDLHSIHTVHLLTFISLATNGSVSRQLQPWTWSRSAKKNTKAAPCAEIGPTQTILSEAVENVNACGRGCQAILAGGLQCSIVQSCTLHTGITVSLSTNLRIVVSPSFRLSYPCIDPSSFQPSVETVRRPLTVSDLATRPIHLPVI